MATQAQRDNKVLSKFKAKMQRALKKADGMLLDSSAQAL
ncbi:hypothetical protein HELA111659_02275 [Helicobacter labetoulli]